MRAWLRSVCNKGRPHTDGRLSNIFDKQVSGQTLSVGFPFPMTSRSERVLYFLTKEVAELLNFEIICLETESSSSRQRIGIASQASKEARHGVQLPAGNTAHARFGKTPVASSEMCSRNGPGELTSMPRSHQTHICLSAHEKRMLSVQLGPDSLLFTEPISGEFDSFQSGVDGRAVEVARGGERVVSRPRCTECPPCVMCPGHPRIPPPSIPAQSGQVSPTIDFSDNPVLCVNDSSTSPNFRCSCHCRHRVSFAWIFPFIGRLAEMSGCRILVRGVLGTGSVRQQRDAERQRCEKGFIREK